MIGEQFRTYADLHRSARRALCMAQGFGADRAKRIKWQGRAAAYRETIVERLRMARTAERKAG